MAEETETSTTMLYRAGGSANPEAWNRKLDTKIVDDADLDAAKGEGWLTAADLAKADAAPVKAAK